MVVYTWSSAWLKIWTIETANAGQKLFDQVSEPESFVRLQQQIQAAVGSDAGALEIDPERGVK